jgi:hypothetical protein
MLRSGGNRTELAQKAVFDQEIVTPEPVEETGFFRSNAATACSTRKHCARAESDVACGCDRRKSLRFRA